MDKDTYRELVAQLDRDAGAALDELVQEGAQRMLMAALQAEVADYVERHSDERDELGHAEVVRNGKARPRKVATGAGLLRVEAPRVNDRRPKRRFTSAILPPYMRRSPRLEEALPVLYLRGLSTGDFGPALEVLLGESARGFSPAVITRLKQAWEDEYRAWKTRDLSNVRYAYVWADGVNFPVRLEEDRLTCLVLVGATAEGRKEVIALEDGYRESTESWLEVLRDLKARGLKAPMLAVGDGNLGFWNALQEIFPGTDQQLCWKHKMGNVLDKLPKRSQTAAKAHLREIMYAPNRATAELEIDRFKAIYEAKHSRAVDSLTENKDRLLTFLDYPAEHWTHLRTTNPIESTFGTIKARTKKTRGAGSRMAGLAMAFKLLEAAQDRWRRINAPHLAAAVLAGVKFKDGERITRGVSAQATAVPEEVAA